MREILDTEASYVKGLAFIIDYFVLPLRLLSETEEPVLAREEIDDLFSNVEEIREKNATLLRRLEERVSTWHVDSTIGDVFVQLVRVLMSHLVYTAYSPLYSCTISSLPRTRRTSRTTNMCPN